MRTAIVAGLALAAAPTAGLAQTPPYAAVVSDAAGARLRAGPSDTFPETSTLPRGAALIVAREESNGWLAVQDPPGSGYSLSWVPASYVDFDHTKPIPQGVMTQAPTTLAAGRMGHPHPLAHVRREQLPAGTALRVIGPRVNFEGRWWHPVEPPADDFRYVPKSAVTFAKAVNTSFSVGETVPPDAAPTRPPADPVVPVAGGRPPAKEPAPDRGPATAAAKPAVGHPLWAQAEAAERDGRPEDAEKLYFELARVMNEPGGDHDVANLCYTRIHTLREKRRVGGAGDRPPPGPPPPAGRTGGVSDRDGPPRDERARWTGPGRLVRSALALDGRKTYALETNPGITVVYVVAGPGVDLERFVNKRVNVQGTSHDRQGLSKPYVVAAGAEAAP